MIRSAALAWVSAAWLAGGGPAAAEDGAVPRVTPVVEGTAHQALFAVAFDAERGVAVGAAGELLLTGDRGVSWHPSKQNGATGLSLLGVDVRGAHAVAVGQAGLILVSDGNDAWQKAATAAQERLFAVIMNDAGKAVAVGAFGTIILSADFGRTWRSIAPPDVAQFSDQGAEPHLYAASVGPSGMVTVTGEFGLILRTLDDGGHWSVVHKGEASLFALDLPGAAEGFAVGQSGTILRTGDGGVTWREEPSNTTANLLGVTAAPDGKAIVTAMNSVLVSDDHGSSWRSVAWGDFGSTWYAGAQFVESAPATAILVGHAGRVLRMSL